MAKPAARVHFGKTEATNYPWSGRQSITLAYIDGQAVGEIQGDEGAVGMFYTYTPYGGPRINIEPGSSFRQSKEQVRQVLTSRLETGENMGRIGAALIKHERDRHPVEGYGKDHDRGHSENQLLYAAMAYILADMREGGSVYWPWKPEGFKPKSKLRNLVRAGALIAAEVDRLLAEGESGRT